MGLLAVSRIIKHEGEYKLLQEGDSETCFNPSRKMGSSTSLQLIYCNSLILLNWWWHTHAETCLSKTLYLFELPQLTPEK